MTENVTPPPEGAQLSKWRIASGIFLLVLAVYVLSSPGRIDIIDGQARFDVAYNWLHSGRPLLTDPWIRRYMAVPGQNNLPYSYYGAPASVLPMPLMAVGSLYDTNLGVPTTQFLFSLTSTILGAAIPVVLFLFYLELGLPVRRACLWALVCAFATMLWPLSGSTFDNAQHAFFAIAGTYLGFLSSRRDSNALAIAGGLCASILLLYQEYFLIIIPALALSTIRWTTPSEAVLESAETRKQTQSGLTSSVRADVRTLFDFGKAAWNGPGEQRSSCVRFLLWSLTAVTVGFALFCWYNDLRFGSPFDSGKFRIASRRGFPMFGNPAAGFGTLIVSPGKSVFLYSPTLILAVIGIRRLYHQQRTLALGICAASIELVLFLSCIAFAGGDWCWGPRYLGVVIVLFALALPLAGTFSKWARVVPIVIVISLGIQIMAVSVENQRFFFERGLKNFFWAEDPWFYFKHSALFARPGETMSLRDAPPPTADGFNSTPNPEWCTYAILGPNPRLPRSIAPEWMKQFKIYYLPRPWPLWMPWVAPETRPINLQAWLVGLGGIFMISLIALSPVYVKPMRKEISFPVQSAAKHW